MKKIELGILKDNKNTNSKKDSINMSIVMKTKWKKVAACIKKLQKIMRLDCNIPVIYNKILINLVSNPVSKPVIKRVVIRRVITTTKPHRKNNSNALKTILVVNSKQVWEN